MLLSGCRPPRAGVEPRIEFTKLPPSGEGSPENLFDIEGRVTGAARGQRIVLFARSGVWWVQPAVDQPFTALHDDSSWKNSTHPGSAYAALLVSDGYRPPTTVSTLPPKGGDVLAVAVADGASLVRPTVRTISFSGYEWEMRETASSRGGTNNLYSASNLSKDQNGFLHLRIAKNEKSWSSAEVRLTRSLGYGSYRFITRDVSHLEPAAVFSIFTWDDTGPPREVNIEFSRWGETASKNAQFVIQPYYVPANVFRFMAPEGTLTHWFIWQPGRISFRTVRGSGADVNRNVVSQHTFTSGVPFPGNESIHINLYVYDNKSNPLRDGSEVIVEKFEYLP